MCGRALIVRIPGLCKSIPVPALRRIIASQKPSARRGIFRTQQIWREGVFKMKLESSLKHFSPQGMQISDSIKGTSPDRLTGTDVKAAMGTTSTRARFGLAAFLGKAGVSKSDEQLAVQMLVRHAMEMHRRMSERRLAGNSALYVVAGSIRFRGLLTFGGN
jgi:hypothetical protein